MKNDHILGTNQCDKEENQTSASGRSLRSMSRMSPLSAPTPENTFQKDCSRRTGKKLYEEEYIVKKIININGKNVRVSDQDCPHPNLQPALQGRS